jgi:hypothetical protein
MTFVIVVGTGIRFETGCTNVCCGTGRPVEPRHLAWSLRSNPSSVSPSNRRMQTACEE